MGISTEFPDEPANAEESEMLRRIATYLAIKNGGIFTFTREEFEQAALSFGKGHFTVGIEQEPDSITITVEKINDFGSYNPGKGVN